MAEKKGLDPEILSSLRQIIDIMKEEELSEVCIEQKDTKIQVKRTTGQPDIAMQDMAALATERRAVSPSTTDNTTYSFRMITAPMVGTFYRAPSPEAEPFVTVGDEVKADQVICVIDAMKLMNEITADIDGVITEILVDDGESVEYDQPMFSIKPK